ncbi:hypothetical protein HMPREF9603_00167 [Cutibacterium acnes HL001PA1]|nr:hypothetical protein HMPREF9603_00167 [Cutibacterium acnes HL001PA1]
MTDIVKVRQALLIVLVLFGLVSVPLSASAAPPSPTPTTTSTAYVSETPTSRPSVDGAPERVWAGIRPRCPPTWPREWTVLRSCL